MEQDQVATADAGVTAEARPRSISLAERGINSSVDFRNLMSALMSDVVSGRINPATTNAACNAGGKLLKMIELEYKYSTRSNVPQDKRSLPVAFEA